VLAEHSVLAGRSGVANHPLLFLAYSVVLAEYFPKHSVLLSGCSLPLLEHVMLFVQLSL